MIKLKPVEPVFTHQYANAMYQDRLDKYRKIMMLTSEQMTVRLINLHQAGHNIAEIISETIGESHYSYTVNLSRCGVDPILIR